MLKREYWKSHPGRNLEHRFGAGRDSQTVKMPLPDGGFREVTLRGPKNPNRWLPHQGKREIARRLVHAERIAAKRG